VHGYSYRISVCDAGRFLIKTPLKLDEFDGVPFGLAEILARLHTLHVTHATATSTTTETTSVTI
jgi:hypothetical protein